MGVKEELDIDVDQRASDVVEFQYLCDGLEGRQSKSKVDAWFGSPGNEELDEGDLINAAREYG